MSMTPTTEEAKTVPFRAGDLVRNARYDHRDAYPALGDCAYVQAIDGDYLDFGQGSKLLNSLFDLAASRTDSAESTAGEDRSCTCHPDDNPPIPCARRYALSECRAATPAPSSPGVPDSVREAFLAADLHECWVNGDTADVMTSPFPGCGNFNQIVARCATGELWRKRAVAIAESLNFVRTLISAHLAGQSATPETDPTLLYWIESNTERLCKLYPDAPDSARTGRVETEVEALRKAVSKALHDNQFLDGWPELVDPVVDAVLAARPAAPEAQGAWRSQAADDVLAERRRQVEAEGWTPAHDDGHSLGELGLAAALYALPYDARVGGEPLVEQNHHIGLDMALEIACGWHLKPDTDPRRRLVKAGALILAEIERRDRLPAPPASPGQESAQ